MSTYPSRVIVCFCLAILACENDEKGSGTDAAPTGAECEDAAIGFDKFVSKQAASELACSREEDCTLFVPKVKCASGAQLVSCAIAARSDSVSELEEIVSDPSSAACDGAPSKCNAAPSCPERNVTCQEGRCTLIAASDAAAL